MPIKFDERSHSYSDGTRRLTSVTQALDYLVPMELRDDEAAKRGTAVHLATALYDQREMDTLRVHLAETAEYGTEGYLDGWIAFLRDTKFKVELVEHLVHSREYDYAGKLDRSGKLNRLPAVIDIKSNESGQVWPTVGMQLAAYVAALAKGDRAKRVQRVAVCLKPDGKYNCTVYKAETFQSDLADFLSVLRAGRVRKRLGLER